MITPVHIIIAETLLLIVAYIGIDMRNIWHGKKILLTVLLLCNIFVFPGFFLPENTGEPQCGMPLMAIYIIFRFVFNLWLLIVTALYFAIKFWVNKGM